VAALVQSLPTEDAEPTPAPRAARPAATPPARTGGGAAPRGATAPAAGTRTAAAPAARAAAAPPARARTPAPPAHPSRHWVQIAGGARAALGYELSRIRRAAPELMQGRVAHVAANGASSRLLIGPFASSAEARAFVNQLARKDVPSFTWTSPAGEEVARLPAR
jgi:hypothetical protein